MSPVKTQVQEKARDGEEMVSVAGIGVSNFGIIGWLQINKLNQMMMVSTQCRLGWILD